MCRGQLGEVGFFLSPSHGCQALNSGCQPGEYTHVLLSHLAPKCGMYLCFRNIFVQRVKPYFSADCCYWSRLWDYNRRFLFSHWSHQAFTPLSFFFFKNCWTYRVNFIFEWCQLQNNWEMNKKECIQIISLIGWSLQSVKKLMGSFYVRTKDVASLEYF